MYPEDRGLDAPQIPQYTAPPTYTPPPSAWASPPAPPEPKKNRGLVVMVVLLAFIVIAALGGTAVFVGLRHHTRTQLTEQEKTEAHNLYYSMLGAMKGVVPSGSDSSLSQMQSNCQDYQSEAASWATEAQKFGVAEVRTDFIALVKDVTQFFAKCAAGDSVEGVQIGGDDNTLKTALANQGVTVGGFGD